VNRCGCNRCLNEKVLFLLFLFMAVIVSLLVHLDLLIACFISLIFVVPTLILLFLLV
jgi:hypothetical protein